MRSIDDLFLYLLEEMLSIETELLATLPRLSRYARTPALRAELRTQRIDAAAHATRLRQVFKLLGESASAVQHHATRALILEACKVASQVAAGPMRDAGLIACGRALVVHASGRYAVLGDWAMACGQTEIGLLLHRSLDEERVSDRLLGELAAAIALPHPAGPTLDQARMRGPGAGPHHGGSASPAGSAGRAVAVG